MLVIFSTGEMQAYPADRLIYYPILPAVESSAAGAFTKAEAFEFQEKDYARAIASLAELSRSPNPLIRAEALVRFARNLREAGRLPDAGSAYEQLAGLGSTPVGGIPSDLVARGALCAVLAEQGARERLSREASALYADLHNGRWRLLRPVYDVYAEQVGQWLGAEVRPLPAPESAAMAEAVQSLWSEWQTGKGVKGRQTFWAADRSVLLVARESASRMVAVAAGSGYLESIWLADLAPLTESHDARIALGDAEGHSVFGEVGGPAATPEC